MQEDISDSYTTIWRTHLTKIFHEFPSATPAWSSNIAENAALKKKTFLSKKVKTQIFNANFQTFITPLCIAKCNRGIDKKARSISRMAIPATMLPTVFGPGIVLSKRAHKLHIPSKLPLNMNKRKANVARWRQQGTKDRSTRLCLLETMLSLNTTTHQNCRRTTEKQ